jgi:hypothetical protein
MLPGVRPQTESENMSLLPPTLKSSLITARASTLLPKNFTTVDAWPHNPVNLFCWSCTSVVQDFVWFIPVAMETDEDSRGVKSMQVHGCFCSIPCATAWNRRERLTDTDREMRERLLMRLVEIQQKKPPGSVRILHEAPDPRTTLAEYGTGTWSREEYRRKLTAMKILILSGAQAN